MIFNFLHLGTLDYGTALALQQSLVQLRKEDRIGNTVLLLEHAPVITFGRNAKTANLLASRELLESKGVELFETNRGGDVTFHGPGQLVGYPIFDLRSFSPRLGAVEFVRKLEEVLIRTCGDLAVPAERVKGLTGVWTQPDATAPQAKIAAIGVHISRGVTSHGFALNVTTDLEYFRLIVPCGISDKPVTSFQRELGTAAPPMEKVIDAVSRNFGRVFTGAQSLWLESLEQLMATTVGVPLREPAELRQLRAEDDLFSA